MNSGNRHVIVVGGGMSGRVVADRLRDATGGSIQVTVLTRAAGTGIADGAGSCLSLGEGTAAVQAVLDTGHTVHADAAVLATGCASFSSHANDGFGTARLMPQEQGISPDAPIALTGSTVPAVRYALAVLAGGHRGAIHMLSPVGWLPPVGSEKVLRLETADVPFGTGLGYLLRWFRRTVSWAQAHGLDAGAVVEGLKVHVPAIWQHLSAVDRRRFAMHLRRFWSVGGSTLTPAEHAAIAGAIRSGGVNLVHGRFDGAVRNGGMYRLRVARPREHHRLALDAALLLNFDDAPPGPESFASPVVSGLIAQGLARPDPLQFGLDVTDACALLDARGRPSRRLFAVGAPTRGHFVDALDIARIRKQSDAIARAILRIRHSRAA